MTAAMTAPYDPVAQVLDALREAGCHVQSAGRDNYHAQCPAHDDRDPSLSVTRGSVSAQWCFSFEHVVSRQLDTRRPFGRGGHPVARGRQHT